MSEGKLLGLVLAGGRSRRMGRDKATLVYLDGRPQVEVVCGLLSSSGVAPCVSLRADQGGIPAGAGGVVRDAFGESGPVGAIASAQAAHPDASWLVVACDLPRLDAQTIQTLLSARDGASQVVCFNSEHDGRPEPLCAIWEASSARAVRDAVMADKLCARHLLEDGVLDVKRLAPVVVGALDNANTPEEADAIRRELQAGEAKEVTVRYFGVLGARAGVGEEQVSSRARTLAELYDERTRARGLVMPVQSVRAAINDEFVPWSTEFDTGADIGFMPPSCGG